MQHLREVEGDNCKNCGNCTCGKIKLDEQEISKEELENKKQDQSIRIVEKSPGNFRTLQKLHG